MESIRGTVPGRWKAGRLLQLRAARGLFVPKPSSGANGLR
jgi:hypothetical protein